MRGRNTMVLVVTPALERPSSGTGSRTRDGAREAAAARSSVARDDARRRAEGARRGWRLRPVQAIDDAIRTFIPDEIVISTHPEGRSNWLERGVVESVKQRYEVPVTHVVVDLEAAPAPDAEPAAS